MFKQFQTWIAKKEELHNRKAAPDIKEGYIFGVGSVKILEMRKTARVSFLVDLY